VEGPERTVATVRTGRIERYSFQERLVHALAALSYVYLLLTGLAFWTPALYWIAILLGGGFLSRMVHPWVGVVFAIALARMFLMWHGDMRATGDDHVWRRQLMPQVHHEDDRLPPECRFNFAQTQTFWIMTAAALVLLLSGVVLWFPHLIPPPRAALRQTAALVHSLAALVTAGAFLVHLYMDVAVVPGGVRAILHGDSSEERPRQHHRPWIDALRGRQR
jgi:formate dehydrogenase subunit gamma